MRKKNKIQFLLFDDEWQILQFYTKRINLHTSQMSNGNIHDTFTEPSDSFLFLKEIYYFPTFFPSFL